MYINCHTYYSLRYGTFSEADLLSLARENGIRCLALTDINNTSAALNFVRRAKEFDIRPILGIHRDTDARRHIHIALVQCDGLLDGGKQPIG